MVVALGWLYTIYGGLPWMQAVFYGVGASVIGIVALSALKLTSRTIGRDPLLWGIYLVAGFPGAAVAALGTFLPCYAFFVVAAPAFRKYGKRPAIGAFVKGVTAAAIGAITGAVIILGRRTIIDVPTIALALVTLFLLWRWKKIPEPCLVLGAAVIGLIVYSLFHH